MAETQTDRVITAPWTDEQIRKLNEYQTNERHHPYTCGGDRKNGEHLDGEGVLVATREGWKCPYCSYAQNWAHAIRIE